MSKAGYRVHLVLPDAGGFTLEGVEIHGVRKPHQRWDRFFCVTKLVVEAALSLGGDVVHVHDPELLPWVPYIRYRGVKVVYDMHEDFPRQLAQKRWMNPVVKPFLTLGAKMLERLLLPFTSVVYAEKSYGRSRPWVKHSVEVLNYPDLEFFNKAEYEIPKNRIPSVGYIGAISEERGVFVTLEAIRLLRDRGTEVAFYCVGSGTGKTFSRIKKFTMEHGMADVILPGYLSPAEGMKYMASCDVCLAVLQPLPNYIESYPTKIFEYMALGVPFIVSDFPLYAKVVNDSNSGLAVDPTCPEAVADAIAKLISDRDLGVEMGARGVKAVKSRYNWNSQAEGLIKFYEALLNS